MHLFIYLFLFYLYNLKLYIFIKEEIFAIQTELREAIAEQRSKLSKLSSSIRSIKKTRRQNRRKQAEQNAKIDTLISLLGSSNSVANNKNAEQATRGKRKISTPQNYTTGTDVVARVTNCCSEKQDLIPVKHVLPLVTASGATDIELSPYSMGKFLKWI